MSEIMPKACPWCQLESCCGFNCSAEPKEDSSSPRLLERDRILAIIRENLRRYVAEDMILRSRGNDIGSHQAFGASTALEALILQLSKD